MTWNAETDGCPYCNAPPGAVHAKACPARPPAETQDQTPIKKPSALDPGDPVLCGELPQQALTGGKLAGDHYYRVRVTEPISPEVQPYTAECADIIEALGMTFNEGEAFKAIWRLAAARQGRGKPGNKRQYDADKAAHYGARIAAQAKREAP